MFWIAIAIIIAIPFVFLYYILKGIWFIVDCYLEGGKAVLVYLLVLAAIVFGVVCLIENL